MVDDFCSWPTLDLHEYLLMVWFQLISGLAKVLKMLELTED
jgi:hypothetical protein